MCKRININEEYVQSIEEELISLEDYIPMMVDIATSIDFRQKRNQFLRSLDNEDLNKLYFDERAKYKNIDSSKDSVNYLSDQVNEFINKYPDWKNVIKSVEELN